MSEGVEGSQWSHLQRILAPLAERGEEHRKAGRLQEALADFDSALALGPEDLWLAARRASVRTVLAAQEQRRQTRNAVDMRALDSRYRPMLEDFDRYLALEPHDFWARCQRVEVLRCMKCHLECRDACTELLALNPQSRWAFQRRAWAHRWMLFFDDALDDIERAICIAPKEKWCLGYRALLWGMVGKMDDAVAEFERLMAGDDEAKSQWGLERGILLLFAERYEDAMPWLRHGLQRDDGYLARYFIALAKTMTVGASNAADDVRAARAAAEKTLQTEGWPVGEYMLAGLDALDGRVSSAVDRLVRALPTCDMILESVLCDPATRPLVADSRLRIGVAQRLSSNLQARKYLGRGLPVD